jgi:hypothetical protein
MSSVAAAHQAHVYKYLTNQVAAATMTLAKPMDGWLDWFG